MTKKNYTLLAQVYNNTLRYGPVPCKKSFFESVRLTMGVLKIENDKFDKNRFATAVLTCVDGWEYDGSEFVQK